MTCKSTISTTKPCCGCLLCSNGPSPFIGFFPFNCVLQESLGLAEPFSCTCLHFSRAMVLTATLSCVGLDVANASPLPLYRDDAHLVSPMFSLRRNCTPHLSDLSCLSRGDACGTSLSFCLPPSSRLLPPFSLYPLLHSHFVFFGEKTKLDICLLCNVGCSGRSPTKYHSGSALSCANLDVLSPKP